MALSDYIEKNLTVKATPEIAEGDKIYYPEMGAQWRMQPAGRFYQCTVIDPSTNADKFPLHWANSRYLLMPSGPGKDPESQDISTEQERFFGIVFLQDRYFNVWFVEDVDSDGQRFLKCLTQSLPSTVFSAVKKGGYNNH